MRLHAQTHPGEPIRDLGLVGGGCLVASTWLQSLYTHHFVTGDEKFCAQILVPQLTLQPADPTVGARKRAAIMDVAQ